MTDKIDRDKKNGNSKKEKKDELEEIKAKLEECEKAKNDYLRGWQRAKADYLNYKKEEIERVGQLIDSAIDNFIIGILPVFDNLKRAEEHLPDDIKDSDWVKGVLQVLRQFEIVLKQNGVEEINNQGQIFNPDNAQAIEEVVAEDEEPGTVVEILEKGYMRNGRLLRPAKVKVSKEK
ncbi:nucleotide exchange factor GrpE [bacterium]|nr:nucleotide exchange factor GrpE [bacterium]